MSTLREQAETLANDIDPQEMGLAGGVILDIAMDFLPRLVGCFKKNIESDPAEARSEVARMNERRPKRLRRITLRRIRGQSSHPMTLEQGMLFTEKAIAHALKASDAVVASCMSEAPELEDE
jgi:hypothetical protein